MAYKKPAAAVSASEKERLKKLLALPSEKFQDELSAILDAEVFFSNEKKLQAYKKRHRKEIAKIGKRIDICSIVQKVQLLAKK